MSVQQDHVASGSSGTSLGGAAPASIAEPCLSCGQETAPGSVFYSDRRDIKRDDGARVFLCSDCQSAAHRARQGKPLTDQDLRTIANNGMMIGAGFLGGSGGF